MACVLRDSLYTCFHISSTEEIRVRKEKHKHHERSHLYEMTNIKLELVNDIKSSLNDDMPYCTLKKTNVHACLNISFTAVYLEMI